MTKVIGAMQPYFLPYIGYFQLIHCVDTFLVRDNLEFSKSGWVHRNRLLFGGQPAWLTLPLERASDYSPINVRKISSNFDGARVLRRIASNYRRFPYWTETEPLLEKIFTAAPRNLAGFTGYSLELILAHLDIETDLIYESELETTLQGDSAEDRLLSRLRGLACSEYLNLPGGRSLYSPKRFLQRGFVLRFIDPIDSWVKPDGEGGPPLSTLHHLMARGRSWVLKSLELGFKLAD